MSAAEKKAASYLGLAQKAGKLKSGEFLTEKAVKDGSAKLVIISKDASDNTGGKIEDACKYRNIPFMRLFEKEDLGHIIGKEMRVVLAVTDEGFAKAILKFFE